MPLTNLQREKQDTASRWLAVGGDKIYYSRTSRDLKRVDIVEADTKTGESRIVDCRAPQHLHRDASRSASSNGGKQLIHWSERDGWGHYYLYDASGKLIRQITSGEFVCNGIEAMDEKNRVMYVTAVGREPGEDPYYSHLYRVNIDTGEMKLLNPGNGSHASSMNDKNTFFLDNWSRIDIGARVGALRHARQQGDGSREDRRLGAARRRVQVSPRRSSVKADDGVTDLYGVMYKPFDFDPAKKYPIIAYVYPGSADRERDQDVLAASGQRRARAVRVHRHRSRQPRRQPAAVEVVPQLRLRQPARLRARRQEGRDRAARQAASVDRSTRVSASTGHSGGGFMSAAAMFVYPDFFKVGRLRRRATTTTASTTGRGARSTTA